MGFRKLIRNTFGFSRSQTNGFVALLPMVCLALFSEPIYRYWVSQRENDFSKESAFLDSLSTEWELQIAEKKVAQLEPKPQALLFKFNPNTATDKELIALGFSKGLTRRLLNYREKGGEFRVKSDVKKLYGIDSLFYERLIPFIQLPEKIEIAQQKNKFPSVEKGHLELFDLNEADTSRFKSIYGIGSVLAKRIVKYRKKLGGFIHVNQLREVYGLDTAVVNRIVKSSYLGQNFTPQKLNINTAEESLLSSHPYTSKKIAKAIVAYRFQHGHYDSLNELRKIELIDESAFHKMYPYLTTGEKPR